MRIFWPVNKKKLLKGGGGLFLLKLANIGLTFLSTVVLTRALGAHEYGVLIFAMTLVGMLSEPQFVGLRTVAVRFSSTYVKNGDYRLLAGLSRQLQKWALYGGFAVLMIALLSSHIPAGGAADRDLWLFLLAGLLPFFLAYNRISDGILRGGGAIVSGQFPKLFLRPALVFFYVLIASHLLGSDFTAAWGMGMLVAAAASASLVYFWLRRRRFHAVLSGIRPAYQPSQWRQGLIPLMLSGVFTIIDVRAGVLLLGTLGKPAEAGLYHAAFRLAELIGLAQAVANLIIEPAIARHLSTNEVGKLQSKITLAARISFLLTLPIAIVTIVGREYLLAVFGEEFIAAAPALMVLAVAQALKALLGSVVPVLNMAGHAKETLRGMALGVAVHVVLGVVLIPAYGLVGMAWASLVGMVVWKGMLMIRVHQLLGLYTTVLGAWKRVDKIEEKNS